MSVEAFLQRYHRFCSFNALYLLDFVVQYILEVVGVFAVQFDKHIVIAGGIVNFHYLGDQVQSLDHGIIEGAFSR